MVSRLAPVARALAATLLFAALPSDALAAELRSLQTGTAQLGAGDATKTQSITAIDRSKSVLLFNLRGGSGDPKNSAVRAQLTADGTITFTRAESGSVIDLSWTVLEFATGVRVERGTSTVNNKNATIDFPSPVDPAKSFVLLSVGGRNGDNNWGRNDLVRAQLEDGDTIRLGYGNDDQITVDWQVVEYQDATVSSGTGTLLGNATSVSSPLGVTVPRNKSLLLFSWFTTSHGDGELFVRGELDATNGDAANVQVSRLRSGNVEISYGWQLITFTDATTVQHGSLAFASGTSQPALLSTDVDLMRSAVILPSLYGSNSNNNSDSIASNAFTPELAVDSVTLQRASSVANSEVTWQVAEFEQVADVDLGVSQTVSPDPALAGGPVTYSVTVTNHSTTDGATSIVVTHTLPSGADFIEATGSGWSCAHAAGVVTCSRAALAEGAVAPVIDIVVKAPHSGPLDSRVEVRADQTDSIPDNDRVDESTAVTPSADLAITMSASPNPVDAGSELIWAISATNNGAASASNVTVVQTLPSGVELLLDSGGDWSCVEAENFQSGKTEVTCTYGKPLGSGESTSLLEIMTSVPTQGGIVSSSATVGATEPDPIPANNTAEATATVTPRSDLSVSLQTTDVSVVAGAMLTYEITAHNAGPSPASAVSVSFPLPTDTTFVSTADDSSLWLCSHDAGNSSVTCSRGELAPSASETIRITVKVDQESGNVSGTVSIAGDEDDPNLGNNAATRNTPVTPGADLAVTLLDAPDPVLAGQLITWSASVINGGPSTAVDPMLVVALPNGVVYQGASGDWGCTESSGTLTCTAASLGASTMATVTFSALAPLSTGQVSTTASVLATTADPVTGNNSLTNPTTVNAAANLLLSASGSPDPVVAGGNVTYALAVTNDGPLAATGVRIDAELPPGTSYVSATGTDWICATIGTTLHCVRSGALASKATTSVNVVLKAPTSDGAFTTTFIASASEGDPVVDDNAVAVTATVRSADLALGIGGATSGYVGDEFDYSLTVTNHGPTPATGVKIIAPLPSGATFKSGGGVDWTCVAAADSVTCDYTATLAAAQSASASLLIELPLTPGEITLGGTASSAITDPVASNNSKDLVVDVAPAADLELTASASPSVVAAGAEVTFALSLANGGISPATGVTVSAPLPAGVTYVSGSGTGWSCAVPAGTLTCTLSGSLSATGDSAITVLLRAPNADGPFKVTFTADASEHDPVPLNNSAEAGATVTSTELALQMAPVESSVLAGSEAAFDLTVTNGGPSSATDVKITLPVPANTSFASGTGTGWSCGQSAGTVTCSQASALASGATSTLEVVFNAPSDPGLITANASLTGAQIDPDTSNNSASASVNVAAAADLGIALTAPPNPVPAGGALTLTVVITNHGPSTATGIRVESPIPAGAAFASGSGTDWSCVGGSSPIICQLNGGLADGASSTVTIVLTAPADGGTLALSASVTTLEVDQNAANDSAAASVSVTPVADLALALVATPNVVAAGTDAVLTATATNNGPSAANAVSISFPVPQGASYVSGGNVDWSCALANALVTCTHGSALAAGASSDLSFTLNAPTVLGPFDVTATAEAIEGDPVADNHTAVATVTVAPAADLALSASALQATVPARDEAEIELTVENHGPSDATSVEVTAELPADTSFIAGSGPGWTCADDAGEVRCELADTLATSTSATVTIKLRAAAQAGTVEVRARVEAAEADLVGSNDTANVTIDVTPVADLSLELAGAPAIAPRGGVVTFSATVGNNGPSNAETVELSVTLGAGLAFKEVRGAGWSCNSAAPVVCTRAELLASETSTLQIDAVAHSTTGPVNAQATVTGLHPDPDSTNDSDQAAVQIGSPLLDNALTSLKVTSPGAASVGATLTYEVMVHNSGDLPATDVEAAFSLPAGTRLPEGSSPLQPFVIGTIDPGESKSATFSVEIGLEHPEQIEATAIITAADLMPFERKVTTPVSPDSPLTLTIVATPDTIELGEESTLVFTAKGGRLPSGGVLEVVLPAGLELVAESTKVAGSAVTATVADGKLRIELPEIGDEGLASELKVLAAASAEGPQRITGIVLREEKARSLEASVDLQVHTTYDIGGCGCGSSGESAVGAGLLALLAVAALGRRRPALQRVRAVRSRR